MFGTSPFLSEKDRRVRVLADGVASSASSAQSEYARALNFIGDRFTATSNTVGGIKTYDIALKYADRIIPYEGGVAKGSTPGYLNFDGNHFDVSSLSSGLYTVTSTGWVKVNSFTVKPLNIVNATNNEAVTAAEEASTINLTFNNDEVDVFSEGTLTTAAPRRLNFKAPLTVTDDAANDRVDIGFTSTSTTGFIPTSNTKRWGSLVWSDDGDAGGDGLFRNMPVITVGDGNDISPGIDTDGTYRKLETGSDDNDTVGYGTDDPITRLAFNPHLYGKIKLQTLQTCRVFIGFHSADVPDNNNNFLDSQSGFGFTLQRDTPDSNWMIRRNNGGGSTTSVSTGVSVAGGTAVSFELVGDNTNSRWGWSVNGGAFTYYTTAIPTASTNLRFLCRVEEIGSTETLMNIYYLYLEQDK